LPVEGEALFDGAELYLLPERQIRFT